MNFELILHGNHNVILEYPVLEIVSDLQQQLAGKNIIILQAPPGAGKSTVLPLKLYEQPWLNGKRIVMLEPRKLAARSVAARMASMLGEEVGDTIGYRVRFETKVSSRTRIEVVTEGILTRMIQSDNTLEGIGLLIFDEFHERSLQADLALALSYQVQQILRDDLRILIMSATLDSDKLSRLLNNAPIISSLGRQFPVDIKYLNQDSDTPLGVRMARAIKKAFHEQSGDILAFFPGVADIQRTLTILEEDVIDASVQPLYGELSVRKQQEAILPHPNGVRKIVLATSIAETSLTIEGIKIVIDSGYSRVPRFDPRSGLTRLETVRVTRASADQRAGRAGRLGPGVCYRLWTESTHHHLVAQRTPEILDADLAPLTLELFQWGDYQINDLKWITPPPAGSIGQATELLENLGAIENKKITARGKKMVLLPTHPRIAHMLSEALVSNSEQALAADVAALLEERDPLAKESGADLALRLEALRRWRSGERVNADRQVLERVERLALSWRKLLRTTVDNSAIPDDRIGRLLATAYPERIGKRVDKNSERYKLANGRVAKLPSHDALSRLEWISIAHLDAGSGEGKIFLAAALNEEDIIHQATEVQKITWDEERGMVTGALEKRVGNLVLTSTVLNNLTREQRVPVLCDAIRREGLKILGWNETHSNWQARVQSIRLWRDSEQWPDVSSESLLANVEDWLGPYLQNASKRIDLQRLELLPILQGILPWEFASQVDLLAPARLEVPSGSMIAVTYFEDGRPPVMEVRLQEVFGLSETPTVNKGRTKIILHLLSPGYKPVQVTQDLKNFWHNTYHEVRKELRMRYPKHSWPEDPWTAEAVRGVKRRH